MLVVGDKIKQVKEICGFDKRDSIFEVVNISDEGTITFQAEFGMGMMDYGEFKKHFEKVVNKNRRYKWTEWESCCYMPDDFHEEFKNYEYKTNGVKIIVRLLGSSMKSRCSCHPKDEFNLEKGIKLAVARLEKKIAEYKIKGLCKC